MPTLPPEISAELDELRDALRAVAREDLVALVLYGGLVRGRYVPGSSDVNVLVLVRDASVGVLERIAAPLHAAWRSMRVEPLVITPEELPRLAVAFPTKILDIQRRHVTLFGADPFGAVSVSREHVRQRTEQELQNLALRLRRRFLAIHDDPAALATAADDAAAPLAVNLRALLFLRGDVADEFEPTLAIYERAAAAFGLDGEALAAVKRLHEAPGGAVLSRELFGRLLDTVARSATAAATIEG